MNKSQQSHHLDALKVVRRNTGAGPIWLIPAMAALGLTMAACSDDAADQNNGTVEKGLWINELTAAQSPDWIELHNNGDEPVSLADFRISDDPEDLGRGVFLAGLTVEPGAFVRVDISLETVGFRLGGEETVILSTESGEVVDQVEWKEGQIPAGKSYGRFPDASGPFKTLDSPTPEQANQDNRGAATCGDAQADGDEQCDDGNVESGDGCSAACRTEPSEMDVVVDAGVKVNEVLALHSAQGNDWVELINASQDPVDVAGWTMTDDDPAHIVAFPDMVLDPGDFLVLEQGTDYTFGFSGADAIYLYDSAGQLVEAVSWSDGDMVEDMSLGRAPDGTGDFEVQTPSKGAAN